MIRLDKLRIAALLTGPPLSGYAIENGVAIWKQARSKIDFEQVLADQ